MISDQSLKVAEILVFDLATDFREKAHIDRMQVSGEPFHYFS